MHWVLLSMFETCLIPLICHMTHMIEDKTLPQKSQLDLAFDIMEVHFSLTRDPNRSDLYNALLEEADLTKYVEPRPEVRRLFTSLRSHGKYLFVISDLTNIRFLGACLRATLGAEWRDLLDLVIGDCRKPLFFSSEGAFYAHFKDADWAGRLTTVKSYTKPSIVSIDKAKQRLRTVDELAHSVEKLE